MWWLITHLPPKRKYIYFSTQILIIVSFPSFLSKLILLFWSRHIIWDVCVCVYAHAFSHMSNVCFLQTSKSEEITRRKAEVEMSSADVKLAFTHCSIDKVIQTLLYLHLLGSDSIEPPYFVVSSLRQCVLLLNITHGKGKNRKMFVKLRSRLSIAAIEGVTGKRYFIQPTLSSAAQRVRGHERNKTF